MKKQKIPLLPLSLFVWDPPIIVHYSLFPSQFFLTTKLRKNVFFLPISFPFLSFLPKSPQSNTTQKKWRAEYMYIVLHTLSTNPSTNKSRKKQRTKGRKQTYREIISKCCEYGVKHGIWDHFEQHSAKKGKEIIDCQSCLQILKNVS